MRLESHRASTTTQKTPTLWTWQPITIFPILQLRYCLRLHAAELTGCWADRSTALRPSTGSGSCTGESCKGSRCLQNKITTELSAIIFTRWAKQHCAASLLGSCWRSHLLSRKHARCTTLKATHCPCRRSVLPGLLRCAAQQRQTCKTVGRESCTVAVGVLVVQCSSGLHMHRHRKPCHRGCMLCLA